MKAPVSVAALALSCAFAFSQDAQPFPGTELLTMEGDIASQLVDAADAFLLKEIEASVAKREVHWKRDFSSAEAYEKSIEPNRARFRHIIGVRDGRVPFDRIDKLAIVAETETFVVYEARWPVFPTYNGEGLLLEPKGEVKGNMVNIPDAGEPPASLVGLVEKLKPVDHKARIWAEKGYRVVVPTLIDRGVTHRKLRNREFLYRPAFELGRHLIGYEVQSVLALVDWFEKYGGDGEIRVEGWGEGGLLSLYAAAADTRIDVATVSGYFASRQNVWQEPADRNVFGLLEQFGDAEIATLVAPRRLLIEQVGGPELVVPPGTGGKPGRLVAPRPSEVAAELKRARALIAELPGEMPISMKERDAAPEWEAMKLANPLPDTKRRHGRLMDGIDRHNQRLLRDSPYARKSFMNKLKTDSVDAYEKSTKWYREFFAEEVVGKFDKELIAPKPRTRKMATPKGGSDKVDYYEVVLDVYPGLFAYGILAFPKDAPKGDPRPVIVCQHGLEGRPQHVIGEENFGPYQAFATRLSEQGFVTFSPQNIYIFQDRFRTLQFKANAIKKTLFSLMVPQHQQIVNWLAEIDFIDKERIAFYGLSYGGKTAMRVPPLVPEYCLAICSADFNEWVWKNASTKSRYSYVWTGEYEIFEWDLGGTFNYAEMAALIAPRPFMVERGHFDGVAPDETVGYEFAKVRNLYQARLKLSGRSEIEWFDGPHRINLVGTLAFLKKHLRWE